jgi:DNA-binding NarL/FixJ family response regulator
VREILETQPDMVVIGEASDSRSSLALVARNPPDIVLLEVEGQGHDAPTTVSQIRKLAPHTAVVILSMRDTPALVQALLDAGVRGYLLKQRTTRHELVSTVRGVHHDKGRVMLSLSSDCLAGLRASKGTVLSGREREILQLTAQAFSNSQIASRLSIRESTVKRHLHNIFAKLGAVSRIDAVNKAVAAGLISRPLKDP